jgi:type II secretory pathway component PulK
MMHAPSPAAVRNQHGVALLIVLVIVALLTITVTEFTYSVQIDIHRSRNALHALQAELLARSGVNLAEGFLMLDPEPKYDAYGEDWWLDLRSFCDGVQLDATSRLRCRVWDESGKININNTRGVKRTGAPGAQAPPLKGDAVLRDALGCIFQTLGIKVEIIDDLLEYWSQEPQLRADGTPVQVPDFGSLEDFIDTFHIPREHLPKLRQALTAQPVRLMPRININTATPQALAAIFSSKPECTPDDDVISQIHDRQVDPAQPFTSTADLNGILNKAMQGDEQVRRASIGLFDVKSRLYRLEASAITNADPTNPAAGGIGQTLSVLVYRAQGAARASGQAPAVGADGQPLPNWTLRPLDWQKEGGARLFRSAPEDENLPGNPEDEDEEGRDRGSALD